MSGRCPRLYKDTPPPDEAECDVCGAPAGAWVHRGKERKSYWVEAEKCTSRMRGMEYPTLVRIIASGKYAGLCTSCMGGKLAEEKIKLKTCAGQAFG